MIVQPSSKANISLIRQKKAQKFLLEAEICWKRHHSFSTGSKILAPQHLVESNKERVEEISNKYIRYEQTVSLITYLHFETENETNNRQRIGLL